MIVTIEDLKLDISSSFLENLVLQRTGEFKEVGGAEQLKIWFSTGQKSQLSEFLQSQDLYRNYLDLVVLNISRQITDLRTRLPINFSPTSLMSIGPGNSIYEVLLCRQIKSIDQVLLIDIEESPGYHKHGFASESAGYASLYDARQVFVLNGFPEHLVSVCNPNRSKLPDFKADLIISILSMGFHYPCDFYHSYLLDSLAQGGLICLDKRKNVEDKGFDNLMTFCEVVHQSDRNNHYRLVLRKK